MMTEYKSPIQKDGTNLQKIKELKKAVFELNEVLEIIKLRNDWTSQEAFKYTLTNIQPLTKRLELLKLDIVRLYDAVNDVKVIDLKIDKLNTNADTEISL